MKIFAITLTCLCKNLMLSLLNNKIFIFYSTIFVLCGCNLNSTNTAPAAAQNSHSNHDESNKFEDTSGDKLKKLYSLTSESNVKIFIDDYETVLVTISGNKAQVFELASGKVKSEITFEKENIIDCQIAESAILLRSDHQIKIFDLKLKQMRHVILSREKFIFASTSVYRSFGESKYALVYQIIHKNKYPRTQFLVLNQSEKELNVSDDKDYYSFENFLSRAEFKNGTKSLFFIESSDLNQSSYPKLSLLGGWHTGTANRPTDWKKQLNNVVFKNDGYIYFNLVRSDRRIPIESLMTFGFFDETTFQIGTRGVHRPEELFKIDGPNIGEKIFSTNEFLKKNGLYEEKIIDVQILGGNLEKNKLFIKVTMCKKSDCYAGKSNNLYVTNTSNKIIGKFESDDIGFSVELTTNYVLLQRYDGSTLFFSKDLDKEIFRKDFRNSFGFGKFNLSSTGKYIIYSKETSEGSTLDVWQYDEK